ncbi:hypothetical protein Bbelb_005910 [Branchiostoma belcheri]|nr:hypothetical protein Bbelb_005910 [Branchiostoma belcheri]
MRRESWYPVSSLTESISTILCPSRRSHGILRSPYFHLFALPLGGSVWSVPFWWPIANSSHAGTNSAVPSSVPPLLPPHYSPLQLEDMPMPVVVVATGVTRTVAGRWFVCDTRTVHCFLCTQALVMATFQNGGENFQLGWKVKQLPPLLPQGKGEGPTAGEACQGGPPAGVGLTTMLLLPPQTNGSPRDGKCAQCNTPQGL